MSGLPIFRFFAPRWLVGIALVLLSLGTAPAGLALDGSDVEQLAACTAYYFNATKARPMSEYEALYSAGEQATNRARELASPEHVDRLVAEASAQMMGRINHDWQRFDVLRPDYADSCQMLLSE